MKSKAAILADRLNKLNREICAEEMALAEKEEWISAEHSRRLAQLEDNKRHALKVSEAELDKKSISSHARVKKAISEHNEKHRATDQKIKNLMKSKAKEESEMESNLAEKTKALEEKKERFRHIRERIPKKYLKKYVCSKFQEQLTEIGVLESTLNKVLDDTLWAAVKGVVGIDGYYSRKSMACDLCYKIDCSLAYLDSQIQLAQKEKAQELSRLATSINERIQALHDEEAASSKAVQATQNNETEFRKEQLSLRDSEVAKIESEHQQACSDENAEYERKIEKARQDGILIETNYKDALNRLDIPSFLQSEYEKMSQLSATRDSWKSFDAFSASIPPAFPMGFIGYRINAVGEKRELLKSSLKACLTPKALSGFAYETLDMPSMYWIEYLNNDTAHTAGLRFIIASRAKLLPFGMLRVIFCDPKMKGMNLGRLKEWANDPRGKVVIADIATTSQEIEVCLNRENEKLGSIGTKISTFDNVAQFNAKNPSSPIPLTLIVVNDVDDKFLSNRSLQILNSIASRGSQLGYSVLVTAQGCDNSQEPSEKRLLEELRDNFEVIKSIGKDVYKLEDESFFKFFDDDFITQDFLTAFADEYHKELKKKDSIVINADIRRFYLPDGKPLVDRTHIEEIDGDSEGISVPFAVDTEDKIVDFKIGKYPDYHILVTGATGSGKSTLFHLLINGIAAKYYPTEVELWLMEFKGVDFSIYKNAKIPHITLIGLSDDADFRQSLFEKIELEFKIKRTALLKEANVKRIDDYNKLPVKPSYCSAYPNGCPDYLPHIVLIIDELSVISRKFSADESGQFAQMLALYRSHGLSVLMASQTMNTKRPLIEEYENVNGRIGLKNQSDSEFRQLFPSDYLSSNMPPAFGLEPLQAVQYSNGQYKLIQMPRIKKDMAGKIIAAVSKKAVEEFGERTLTVVEQEEARPTFNQDELDILVHSNQAQNQYTDCYVGQVISLIDPHRAIRLEKDLFQNALIIGNHEELKYSVATALALNILENDGYVVVISQARSSVHKAYKKFCDSLNCEFVDTIYGAATSLDRINKQLKTGALGLLILDSGSALLDEFELELEDARAMVSKDSIGSSGLVNQRSGDAEYDASLTEEELARKKFEEFANFRKQLRNNSSATSPDETGANEKITIDTIKDKLLMLIKRGSADGLHCCWTDITEPEFSAKALFGFNWGSRKTSQVFAHRFATAMARQDSAIARSLGFGEQTIDMPLSCEDKYIVYAGGVGSVFKLKPYIMPWIEREEGL